MLFLGYKSLKAFIDPFKRDPHSPDLSKLMWKPKMQVRERLDAPTQSSGNLESCHMLQQSIVHLP